MKRETYRAACEQAKGELREIIGEFETLRLRKEQIERMIEVLEPLSGPDDGLGMQVDRTLEHRFDLTPAGLELSNVLEEVEQKLEPVTNASHFTVIENKAAAREWDQPSDPALAEAAAQLDEAEQEAAFQAEETSTDPIKRRIANALRHRAVLRDNREFNQAFSGGITRW